MKVLHILNELKHSGAEVMLLQAYERFERSEIESHILSTGNQIGDYAFVHQNTGYRLHHMPFRRSPRFLIDIWKLLKKEKFTAVHIHTERAFFWYILTAKVAGVTTVVRTFHGIWFFTSYLRLKRQVQRKVSKKLFHTVHTAIGDSVIAVEKERFHNDCILIRNWTDTDKFSPPTEKERSEARRLHGLEPHDFAIVTIGACTPGKNHLAIFSAVKEANKCLDRKKIFFVHVGRGAMLEKEELYVCQHGIGEYCRFVGTLNDVRPCLYAADAFVMTSQWEGLPIAALEAMSTGLPAILYNVYGLRDLLEDGKGGLLIEPSEVHLVEALLLINQNPELRKVKGQEARQIILSKYSLEDSVDKLIRLYTTGDCNKDKAEGSVTLFGSNY